MGWSYITRRGGGGGEGFGEYSTWLVQDNDNGVYTAYNGYDKFTNPTPNLSNYFNFNRWVFSYFDIVGTGAILKNVTMSYVGQFTGPNHTYNDANITYTNQQINNGYMQYQGNHIVANDGFVYIANFGHITKYNMSTFQQVANSISVNEEFNGVALHNGFIYVVGQRIIHKFRESNLQRVAQTTSFGVDLSGIHLEGGLLNTIRRGNFTQYTLFQSNLASYFNSSLSFRVWDIKGGRFNNSSALYLGSNDSTGVYLVNGPGGNVALGTSFPTNFTMHVGLQYTYIVNSGTLTVRNKENITQIYQSWGITGANVIEDYYGYVYVAGTEPHFRKYKENPNNNTLTFIANSPNLSLTTVRDLHVVEEFAYVGSLSGEVKKYNISSGANDYKSIFQINSVKE